MPGRVNSKSHTTTNCASQNKVQSERFSSRAWGSFNSWIFLVSSFAGPSEIPAAICSSSVRTLLYLPPQHKQLPKADLRMQKCIWLGKVSETGENYVATAQGVLKARTVRRLQPDFKYDLALLNKVSGTPWAPRGNIYNPSFATLLDTQLQSSEQKRRTTQEPEQQTNVADDTDTVVEPATKQQRATSPPRLPSTSTSTSRPLPDSPMATSPTGRQHPPLPAPPQRQALRRMTPEEVMQPTKAQKTSKDTTIRPTEETTKEPSPQRQRINAVTLSNGIVGFPNGLSGRPADQKGYKPCLKSKSREELHCMSQIWKYVKLQQYHTFRTWLNLQRTTANQFPATFPPPSDHAPTTSNHPPTTFRPLSDHLRPPSDHLRPPPDHLPTTSRPPPTTSRPPPDHLPTHSDGNRPKTCQVRRLGLHLRKSGIELPNKEFWKSNKRHLNNFLHQRRHHRRPTNNLRQRRLRRSTTTGRNETRVWSNETA